jgi:hypothetical protein
MRVTSAAPAIRDAFLVALDADDLVRATDVALHLTGCTDPLPGMTCSKLELPAGSTYACAARRVLQLKTIPR